MDNDGEGAAELRQLYAGITKDLPSRTNKQPALKKKRTTENKPEPRMSSKRKTPGWGKRRQSVHPYPIEVKGMKDEKLESSVAIEMKKLEDEGLPLEGLDDAEERLNVIHTLRSIPAPLRIRIGVRNKLFSGPAKINSGWSGFKYRVKRSWNNFQISWRELGYKVELWRSSFKRVEGRHGTGVVSYFVFLKWLLFLNIYLMLLIFIFIPLPQLIFSPIAYSTAVTGTGNTTAATTLADTCSTQYVVNVSSDPLTLILDFIQGTGWMEKTIIYYGYYLDKELTIASTFTYNLPLAYVLLVFVCFLLSLVLMSNYTASSLRTTLITDEGAHYQYGSMAFSSWDYTLEDDNPAVIRHMSIYNDFVAELAEDRHAAERARLAGMQKCKLYLVRAIVNAIVIIVLAGAGALIYYANNYTTSLTSADGYLTNYNAVVRLLIEFLPSATLTVLNAFIPIIFTKLVTFENYTPAFQIKLTLIRTVLLRLSSLALLFASFYTQVFQCDTKDTCGVGISPCSSIQCWETYVGQQMYKLVILDFVVAVTVTLFVEVPRRFIVTRCNAKLFKIVGSPEFNIPKNVLDLVYSQTICWVGFLYAPFIPLMTVIKLVVLFYLKKLSALFSCEPAEQPFKASKSNSFFMIVLMVAFFLTCIPVGFSIVSLTPSRGCGPFRVHEFMFSILTITIAGWPQVLRDIISFLFSGMFAVPLIIILCLAIYYCSAKKNANHQMVEILQDQVVLEGRDKQYLLTRLAKAGGGNPSVDKTDMKRQQSREKSTFSLKSLKESLAKQSKKTSVDESAASPSTSKTPDTAMANFDF